MKKKILILATTQITINAFLVEHIQQLKNLFDITILCKIESKFTLKKVKIKNINFSRKINLLQDLKLLFQLIVFIFLNKYDIILTITPKAGILGILSGFICRTKYRIHIFTGQVWSTKKGIFKLLLKYIDIFTCYMCTQVLCDGLSQKKYLLKNNFPNKINVLGKGSICGVDTNHFFPIKKNVKSKMNIPKNSIVISYIGRLNYEKGVIDLINAFYILRKKFRNIYLLLVGSDEDQIIKQGKKILKDEIGYFKYYPHTSKTVNYFRSTNIFCMPSLREGFGLSILEAMACQIPVVATDIYGLSDAVINKYNGLKYRAGNIDGLAKQLEKLIQNKRLRNTLGKNGRKFIKLNFEKKKVIDLYARYFKNIIN